ncbi:VWA domain-containing protein, partial [Rhodobacteraceae bacterium W635]
RRILASHPITVTEVSATLEAPSSGPAGGTVTVEWSGPDYDRDYVGIGPVGDDDYDTYSYTRNGSPARLTLPEAPGDYEIRYYMNQDRRVIARVPFTVTAD